MDELVVSLVAAKKMVDAARRLLLDALLLLDARLPSFEALSEALALANKASVQMQEELEELSGYTKRSREIIEYALEATG